MKLEENQANRRYPTNGYPEWFRGIADRLDAARTGVAQLAPQREDLVHRMGQETIDLGEYAGQTRVMQNHQLSFSSGWDTLLDGTIRTVQEAAGVVGSLTSGPSFPPSNPPVPGNGNGQVIQDATRAAKLVRQSLATIAGLPTEDTGSAATKDARLAAYHLNMDAQQLIEPYFNGGDAYVTSTLRKADAHLEDANWQLAKKPSPDGRFNGVDVPGAQRDTEAAATTLEQLVSALSSGA
ncbi:MAG: hypothetical protein JWM86_920 [Thermoleophilia bacterium]|nr:hypothetical protein [Thermoleophilia bacterium]